MIGIDSSFIIDFLRNEPFAVKIVRELEKETFVTTYISFFEILSGELRRHAIQDVHVQKALAFFERIEVFGLNARSALKSAQIHATLASKGLEINSEDSLIAGILLTNGCTRILTRDTDFKKIKELIFESY